jgi:hypothetical protein
MNRRNEFEICEIINFFTTCKHISSAVWIQTRGQMYEWTVAMFYKRPVH